MAEQAAASASDGLPAVVEPYRTVAERCEILAVELHDEGQIDRANLLWEAESRIRELEVEGAILQGTNIALEEWIEGYRLRGKESGQ